MQALREVERQRLREKLQDAKGTDVHYLKNVVLKLYETGMGITKRMYLALAKPLLLLLVQSTRQVVLALIETMQNNADNLVCLRRGTSHRSPFKKCCLQTQGRQRHCFLWWA